MMESWISMAPTYPHKTPNSLYSMMTRQLKFRIKNGKYVKWLIQNYKWQEKESNQNNQKRINPWDWTWIIWAGCSKFWEKSNKARGGALLRHVVKSSGDSLDTRPRRLGMSPLPLNGLNVDVRSRRCRGTRPPLMYDDDWLYQFKKEPSTLSVGSTCSNPAGSEVLVLRSHYFLFFFGSKPWERKSN